MTQEFIPAEQAFALRELGFDEECFGFYFKEKEEDTYRLILNGKTGAFFGYQFKAPLYQQAFRWFREKYGLQNFPDYFYYDGFHYGFKWVKSNGEYGEEWKDNNERPKGWDTPEESELESLKKLIEIVKKIDV